MPIMGDKQLHIHDDIYMKLENFTSTFYFAFSAYMHNRFVIRSTEYYALLFNCKQCCLIVREHPFNLKGGGYVFFSESKFLCLLRSTAETFFPTISRHYFFSPNTEFF